MGFPRCPTLASSLLEAWNKSSEYSIAVLSTILIVLVMNPDTTQSAKPGALACTGPDCQHQNEELIHSPTTNFVDEFVLYKQRNIRIALIPTLMYSTAIHLAYLDVTKM